MMAGEEEHICPCDGSCLKKTEHLEQRIKNIKDTLQDCSHPMGCSGWKMNPKYRAEFEIWNCDCAISYCLHQIEMTEN